MSKIQNLIKEYKNSQSDKTLQQIIEQIQTAPVLWAAFSPITKGFYVDYVMGTPTAFLFSEKKYCEDYCKHMKTEKSSVGVAECPSKARLDMFTDFYRSGIESVLIDNGENYISIDMTKLIKAPDLSKLSPEERPVFNSTLVCSANRFFQALESGTATPDKELNLLIDTFHSSFIIPVQGEPTGNTVSVPGLDRSDGKKVVPFFTDMNEMRKFDSKNKFKAAVAGFAQLEKFCEDGQTVVINPFGFNFTLTKETCDAIHRAVDNFPDLKETERAVVYTPNKIPAELINPLCEIVEKTPQVRRAFIKGLRKGKTNGMLVVLDFDESVTGGDVRSLLDKISSEAVSVTGELPFEYVPANTDIGRVASNNAEPFFERLVIDLDSED